MLRPALVLVAGLFLQACIFAEKECPCGASTTDSIGSHDRLFSGDHVVEGQCLCTCGDDFPESFNKGDDCSAFQTECVDGDGNVDSYICR